MPVVSSQNNGFVDAITGMFCREQSEIPSDLNELFSGFGRADFKTNAPAEYGIVVSFYTQKKGNYIAAQLYFSSENKRYSRMYWDSWRPWMEF